MQAARPVEYRSARRFQVVCVLIAWVILAVPTAIALWWVRGQIVTDPNQTITRANLLFASSVGTQSNSARAIFFDGLIVAAALLGEFLWLFFATGLASYFFHPKWLPRELQNRAIALSYYTAGPLVLMLPAGLLAACAYGVLMFAHTVGPQRGANPIDTAAIGMACIAGLIVVAMCALLVIMPMVLLARGLRASVGRIALCGLTLVVGWLVLFALCAVGLPAFVLHLQLVYHLTV